MTFPEAPSPEEAMATAPVQTEPNFETWGAGGEPAMHEHRLGMMRRAAEFGERGWLFADEFTHGHPEYKRANGTVLVTLVQQGYLAVDMDNPRIMRATEAGLVWMQQMTDQVQASVDG